MIVLGHGYGKFPTGDLIESSVKREWGGILAERRSHPAGELPTFTPPYTEVAMLVRGRSTVTRHADGKTQQTPANRGTIWLCPAGLREDFIRISHDIPEVLHIYLPPKPFWALEMAAESAAGDGDVRHHAIIDAASGRALGTAALMRIEPAHGVIEVGFITFSPALKRTRTGSEAMYMMMRRAFDELGYRRYEWKCDSLNAPSRAAALRYGFTFEGVFRKAIVCKGRSRDTAWYSITDDEWPRIKEAFEAWLNPQNFDADGRQRRGLAIIRSSVTDGAATNSTSKSESD